ncbi:MAG: hypothetical protein ACLRQF_07880 [Thomasclavelia ramosa]
MAKEFLICSNFYDPEIILIGGAISQREDFIEKINRKIDYLLEKIEIAKLNLSWGLYP